MITITLKAATALGFGGKDFYTETFKIKDAPEVIHREMVNFALRYNVELSSIKVIK